MEDDSLKKIEDIIKAHKPNAVECVVEDLRLLLAVEDIQKKRRDEAIKRDLEIRESAELQARKETAKAVLRQQISEKVLDLVSLRFALQEVIGEIESQTKLPPMTSREKLEDEVFAAIGEGIAEGKVKIPKELTNPKGLKSK